MLSQHHTPIHRSATRRAKACSHHIHHVLCLSHRSKCLRAKASPSVCPVSAQPMQRPCAVRTTRRETGAGVATFTPEDAKAARMMNFRQEFSLEEGRVVIQALTVPLIEQTAELLAVSFVATAAHLAPYASYVRRNIVRYLREHQALAPDAMVLVAVLQPSAEREAAAAGDKDGPGPGSEVAAAAAPPPRGPADAGEAGPPVSPGAGWPPAAVSPGALLSRTRPRVIGSAEVSFRRITRSSQPFLSEPEKCCYMCNMAVSPVFRRRGVATRLLAAAEQVAVEVMAESEMYLHLRFVDKEAAALYERAGFYQQGEHWPIAPLFGIQRMKLMRKDLGY
ncbi:hypothetical protein PLESTB_000152600 [Pleodorina starrii]|uniref:N-acetyltransferase domain-containing protein n=1 Tax=Pleodorina starrii TaxID=330485 RepID=A0A9W6EXV1_9CHLO|nr:hypothetical protein PLESTB_000152600 [Pleodorina starrii]